jgi:hypothetical protein
MGQVGHWDCSPDVRYSEICFTMPNVLWNFFYHVTLRAGLAFCDLEEAWELSDSTTIPQQQLVISSLYESRPCACYAAKSLNCRENVALSRQRSRVRVSSSPPAFMDLESNRPKLWWMQRLIPMQDCQERFFHSFSCFVVTLQRLTSLNLGSAVPARIQLVGDKKWAHIPG